MPALLERNPDVSVIIPVYNLEDYLDPMLWSLANQNLGGYTAEIIFVLNNCTDASEDIIRQSRIACQIMNCTTQGCGPARNAALDVARGEYIWFMDGDDWLLSCTAIKVALDKAKSEDLNILRIPFWSDHFQYNYFSMVWQYLLRRDFVQEFRFPDYQPGEDDAYMKQVLTKAGRPDLNHLLLPYLDRPYYFYNYMREGSNMFRHQVLGQKI